ncbi:glycoside hydrolase family 32 protein [Salinifilum ghardaiensis]
MSQDEQRPLRPHRRAFLTGAGAVAGLGLVSAATGSGGLFARAERGARSARATEQWRPRVRFAPARNWMNDPNGMVWFDGEYHLFFQHNPYGSDHDNMSWGHAVSTDLVRWEQLPVALRPDELGAVFSGGAVVDEHDTSGFFGGEAGLVAFYTADGESQTQCLAHSADRGRSWTKYEGNPVIDNPGIEDFRDPKVIRHEATGRWVLMLAAGDRIMFYGSSDLVRWELLSEFGAERGAHGGVWECPELFELPVDGGGRSRWVLIVSINPGGPAGGSAAQYFLGDFDGTTFTPDDDEVRWVDRGADFYAAQTWSGEPDGRRLWVGWLSNWDYAEQVPTEPWRGSMSVPRELGLTERSGAVELVQRPVRELEAVRGRRHGWRGSVRGEQEIPGLSGGCLDIDATFRLPGGSGGAFGLDVFATGNHRTRVGYDADAGELFTDRTASGSAQVHPDFPARHGTPLTLPDGGQLRIRLVLDRSSVEVFADDGRAVLTHLVLPDAPEESVVRLFATGLGVSADVQAWELAVE